MTSGVPVDLFGVEHDPRVEALGPAQRAVLEAWRARDGLDNDEAGAVVHARRGRHDEGQRCRFCGKDGKQVLASLRNRGLIPRRRTATRPAPVPAGYDPATADWGGFGDPR